MFGNGVYFSDQSTKSLNYSFGWWDGRREENCFMFLCDVAMGREFVPVGPNARLPVPGFDSTFAKAGKSGVLNNEMIVYKTCQIAPRYLVEFSPQGK
jgi:poly [ADP-ribose] polymerase